MKKTNVTILLAMFLSMFGTKAYAYDIEVENADGIVLYYNYINDGKELEVTWRGDYNDYNNVYKQQGDLVIPEEVTYMDITRKVTRIGEHAFSCCNKLKTVIIPNSVTSIEEESFSYCSGLESVIIGDNVDIIESGAFSYCNSLNSAIIGESVKIIGSRAFYYCYSLNSISIPSSVTNMGTESFALSALSSVHITDLEAWCKICFEDRYSNPLSSSHHLYMNDTEITDLVLPNNLTDIGNYAFYGCSGITSVTIPSSVTSIGEGTFMDCRCITTVTIPNTLTNIGDLAFDGCIGLTSIDIPISVTRIGDSAFQGCTSLTSLDIPNSVTNIGNSAFASCTNMTSVILPNSITIIREAVFSECTKLSNLVIPNSVLTIGDHAFARCTSLTSITIPQSVISIGENVFWGCSGLDAIIVESDNTVYDSRDGCNAIIKTNANELFYGCKNTIIPNSVTSIGAFAFVECTSLPSIVIPKSVTIVGKCAFAGCSNLSSVTIPNSVWKIGEGAFEGCSNLLEFYCYNPNRPNTPENAFIESNIKNATLYVPYASIDTYKSSKPWYDFKEILPLAVDSFALSYYVDDELYMTYTLAEGDVITPEAAPIKEGYTFSGWSEIPGTMPAEDVIITGTFIVNSYELLYMVDGEEYKCFGVEYGSVIVPEPEPTKEGYTFSGWSEIPETMPAEDVIVTGTFTINKYKVIYVVDGEVYETVEVEYNEFVFPIAEPKKEGYEFSGWNGIPAVMPANDVTVTGSFTVNQYKLVYQVDGAEYKSYDVDYGSTITPEAEPTKEGYTFSGWSEIPETMPAEDIIVTGSFIKDEYEEEGLKLEITDGNVVVTGVVAQGEDLNIPASVEIEGKTYAVIAIAKGAFENCADITSVEIPDGVETIGANAFAGCINLNIIILGSGVTNIGSKAFANIGTAASRTRAEYEGLKIICNASSVPNAESDAFGGTDIADALLLVDDNLVTQYQTTAPWSGFGKIYGKEAYTGINDIRATESGARIYDLNGNRLTQPQRGVNIIRMDNGTTKKVVVK